MNEKSLKKQFRLAFPAMPDHQREAFAEDAVRARGQYPNGFNAAVTELHRMNLIRCSPEEAVLAIRAVDVSMKLFWLLEQ